MEIITEEEGRDLLKLSSYALQVSQRKLSFFPRISTSFRLKELRGLFVSLWKDNQLRGCIGCVNPTKTLDELVIDATLKAALKDPRFIPIQAEEIPELCVELSILTKPLPIVYPEIEIGKHGLIVLYEDKTGLLLPSVAKENNWDVFTYLEQVCLKAELPKNAWKTGAAILGFEVQTFKSG